MKLIIVALALVACVLAAPQGSPADKVPQITRSEFDQQPDGAYVFSFETEDGITRNENGELKEALDEENKPHKVVVVRGQYSYPGADGKPLTVTYYADETGYHAEGDSIPKSAARR